MWNSRRRLTLGLAAASGALCPGGTAPCPSSPARFTRRLAVHSQKEQMPASGHSKIAPYPNTLSIFCQVSYDTFCVLVVYTSLRELYSFYEISEEEAANSLPDERIAKLCCLGERFGGIVPPPNHLSGEGANSPSKAACHKATKAGGAAENRRQNACRTSECALQEIYERRCATKRRNGISHLH